MRRTPRLIALLGVTIGIWVLGSFAGAMFNPANAAFWTSSLMWSLLAGLLVAPGLLMLYHASASASGGTEMSGTVERVAERPSPSANQSTSAEKTPFAEEESLNRLWPEPSTPAKERAAEEEWPRNRTEAVA